MWEDGVKYKKPTKLPAPEYVDALMNWAQNILDDENVFPNKIGTDNPLLDLVMFPYPCLNLQASRSPAISGILSEPSFEGYSVSTLISTATILIRSVPWVLKVYSYNLSTVFEGTDQIPCNSSAPEY